jgi:acetoin utilization deacetylase AcuC-like enzyme
MVTEETVVTPKEATEEDLLFVHTQKYLDDYNSKITISCTMSI